MTRLEARIRKSPLLALAIVLAAVKSVQFAVDSTALFYFDSGAFILNALGSGFIPQRSYVYSCLIRIFALPLHSLRAIVAMQVVMGAVTAGLLALALSRFLHVRTGIAVLASLVFAFDPVQIVHERMVMTETATLLAMAVYLVAAGAYLERPDLWRLTVLSFIGILLVSFRMVYLPVVLAAAVLLPAEAYLWRASNQWRRSSGLALALVVSSLSTLGFQVAYRHWIGWLGHREPAYHFMTGFFMASAVAPIITPADAGDPRLARAVMEQNQSIDPLWKRDTGSAQLFDPDGLAARIMKVFGEDGAGANEAAQRLALHAIRRNPLGYLRLGMHGYLGYWRGLPKLRRILPLDNGSSPVREVFPYEIVAIRSAFGVDVSNNNLVRTLSRHYQIRARGWYVFLLASPFLGLIDLFLVWREGKPAFPQRAFFVLWTWLLLITTCLEWPQAEYRYLQPLSFTGLAAAGCLAETVYRRISARLEFNRVNMPVTSRSADAFSN
jgi:hypothetical protein